MEELLRFWLKEHKVSSLSLAPAESDNFLRYFLEAGGCSQYQGELCTLLASPDEFLYHRYTVYYALLNYYSISPAGDERTRVLVSLDLDDFCLHFGLSKGDASLVTALWRLDKGESPKDVIQLLLKAPIVHDIVFPILSALASIPKAALEYYHYSGFVPTVYEEQELVVCILVNAKLFYECYESIQLWTSSDAGSNEFLYASLLERMVQYVETELGISSICSLATVSFSPADELRVLLAFENSIFKSLFYVLRRMYNRYKVPEDCMQSQFINQTIIAISSSKPSVI